MTNNENNNLNKPVPRIKEYCKKMLSILDARLFNFFLSRIMDYVLVVCVPIISIYGKRMITFFHNYITAIWDTLF